MVARPRKSSLRAARRVRLTSRCHVPGRVGPFRGSFGLGCWSPRSVPRRVKERRRGGRSAPTSPPPQRTATLASAVSRRHPPRALRHHRPWADIRPGQTSRQASPPARRTPPAMWVDPPAGWAPMPPSSRVVSAADLTCSTSLRNSLRRRDDCRPNSLALRSTATPGLLSLAAATRLDPV